MWGHLCKGTLVLRTLRGGSQGHAGIGSWEAQGSLLPVPPQPSWGHRVKPSGKGPPLGSLSALASSAQDDFSVFNPHVM